MVMMLPRDASLSSLSVDSVDITCHEIRCVTILNVILWFFFIIIFIIIIFRARKVLRDVRGLWRASQRTSVWPQLSSTASPWQLLLVGFICICNCIFLLPHLCRFCWLVSFVLPAARFDSCPVSYIPFRKTQGLKQILRLWRRRTSNPHWETCLCKCIKRWIRSWRASQDMMWKQS